MIYYFSGTGNSEWAAKRLGRITGEEALSITDLMKEGKRPKPIKSKENLGIVFPIYAWSAPKIVMDFIEQLDVASDAFVYSVCTCGENFGDVFGWLRKKLPVSSCYSLRMPNNYVLGFDVDSETLANEKISEAKEQIEKIGDSIKNKKAEEIIAKGSMAKLKTNFIGTMFRKYSRDTKFYAEDSCTSCGICEKYCPVGNIAIENKKPVWKHNCIQCCSCINRCPVKAIQYGKGTKARGRYVMKQQN